MWHTLCHEGFIYPDPYVHQKIPLLYNNKPIILPPDAEHIACLYHKTPSHKKDSTFNANFFKSWKRYLPSEITNLESCDFGNFAKCELPSYTIPQQRRYCTMNGKKYKIVNPLMEPTCIFKGRGNHPLRGTIKTMMPPSKVVFNGTNKPKTNWGECIENKEVSWLAMYKDSLGHTKYMFCDAHSKANDLQKYEEARALLKKLPSLRKHIRMLISSSDTKHNQLGCALWLLLKLSIRIGHEKPENTADTYGCCTLQQRHFKFSKQNIIVLSFDGKDSIQFYKRFTAPPEIYTMLSGFCSPSKPMSPIFPLLDATKVNTFLQKIHPSFSAKCIRTCQASHLFSKLLHSYSVGCPVQYYKTCNTKVAELCNHVKVIKGMRSPALDTSKSNYLDPRITYSYTKRHKIPIDKVFSSSLQEKHKWASNTNLKFTF